MQRKAIVFGVTGQDGSHLTDLLLSKDYKVVGVVRRCSVDTTERIKDRIGCPISIWCRETLQMLIASSVVLKENEDVDEVYNLAAQSHVGVSFKQPGLTWDITGKGCLNILQSIVDLDINCKFIRLPQARCLEIHIVLTSMVINTKTRTPSFYRNPHTPSQKWRLIIW